MHTRTPPFVNPHELVSNVLKLTSVPGVYIRVKELLADPDASLAEVAEVIAQDPAMTARLLRIANSAFFGFASKIETVSRAVNILGTNQVHDLVLASSVAKAFAGMSNEVMDMQRFWHASVYCGVVARLLANRCNVLDGERLFVAGLLRDIGHLVIYQKLPQPAQAALVTARRENIALFHAERALLGFDYAQVGAILAQAWELPSSLQESIHHHVEPARARDFPLETSLVHIASCMTSEMLWGGACEPAELPVDAHAWRVTALAEEALPPVREEAEQRVAETLALIFGRRDRTA